MAKRKTNIKQWLAFGTISSEWAIKNMPYLIFLAFLGIVYIANAHYSENKIRKIHTLTDEVNDLRFRYMSLRSELMYETKQSKIASQLNEEGIRTGGADIYVIED